VILTLLETTSPTLTSGKPPSPTSTSCAPRDTWTAWHLEPTGCSVTKAAAWTLPSRSSTRWGSSNPTCSSTTFAHASRRWWTRRSTASTSSPRTSSARAFPACQQPTRAPTWSSGPTSASPSSAFQRPIGSKNPFGFMELQDVQELANFFERTVAAYQVGVGGDVAFDEDF